MTRRLLVSLLLVTATLGPGTTSAQSGHSQEELSGALVSTLEVGRAMPEAFGGLWLDDMTVVVAFTPEASSDDIQAVTSRLPQWATYRTDEVAHSEAELRDVKKDVSADARAGELEGVVGVGTDVRGNAVEIAVLPGRIDELTGRLREEYGRVRLEIVASEADHGAACTRNDCWNAPLKGGISIDGCTSTGVMFKDNGGGSVPFRLLTAGHCTQSGAGWTHDGHNIGATTSTRYFDGSECDCQAIAPASWLGRPQVPQEQQ